MKNLSAQFWIGLSVLIDGALLFIFRMPLTYAVIGKNRTRLGLLFGVDRLQAFLWGLLILAVLLVIAGAALMLSAWRKQAAMES